MKGDEIIKRLIIILVILIIILFSSKGSRLSFTNSQNERVSSKKEIVCWGDSMTSGYGSSLGRASIKGNITDISFLSYPEILQMFTGIRTYNFGFVGATSEEISILQGGMQPSHYYSDIDRIEHGIRRFARRHKGDVLILEMGSNGGWKNYEELISQYKAMIKYSGCKDYIIIGDTESVAFL